MSKLFTVAGTSVLDGILKFRVANGHALARTKVLEKNGHTNIDLRDLPKPMTKEDAQAFLKYVAGAPVKAASLKPAKVEKEVCKEIRIPRKAPMPTPEAAAAIRAKNLQTMRAVTARLTEAEHRAIRDALMEPIEAELDKFSKNDIPQFLWKECGIKATKRDEAMVDPMDPLDNFNWVGSRDHY